MPGPLALAAPALIGGGLGVLGGKGSHKPQKTTTDTTTTTSPYGPTGDLLGEILSGAQDLYRNFQPQNPYGNLPRVPGPSGQQREIVDYIRNMGLGQSPFMGPAGDAYENLLNANPQNPFREQALAQGIFQQNPYAPGFIEQMLSMGTSAAGIGGGGGSQENILNQLRGILGGGGGGGYGGGGGGGGGGIAEPYLRQVLAGEFLGSNPYIDDVTGAIQRQSQRAFEQSQLPLTASRFAGNWDNALRASAMQEANLTNQQNIQDQLSQALFGNYQFERGMQGDASGVAAQLDAARMSADASRAGSAAAAGSARQGQLLDYLLGNRQLDVQQQMGLLGLGMQGMDLLSQDQRFGAGLGLDWSNSQDAYNLGLLGIQRDLLGLAPGLEEGRYIGPRYALEAQQGFDRGRSAAAGANRQNQILAQQWANQMPYQQLQEFFNMVYPIAGAFGSQRQQGVGTTPGRPGNIFSDFLSGAVGGGLAGGGMMGGKGGGGIPSPAPILPMSPQGLLGTIQPLPVPGYGIGR